MDSADMFVRRLYAALPLTDDLTAADRQYVEMWNALTQDERREELARVSHYQPDVDE